jgi:hypothetical protein
MLQLRSLRVIRSLPATVLNGATIEEEGLPLVWVKEPATGNTVVRVAAGAAGERFAGVSMSRNHPPRTLPRVQRVTVPNNGQVILDRTPMIVESKPELGAVTISDNTAVAADKMTITGNVVEFDSALVGRVVDVIYRYVPTVDELRSVLGDMPYGGNVFAATGAVNRLVQGEFATNAFKASADWTTAMGVKLSAGVFAPAASAAEAIPGVQVMSTPNVDNAFLALTINIA